jgi:hypothetical protein
MRSILTPVILLVLGVTSFGQERQSPKTDTHGKSSPQTIAQLPTPSSANRPPTITLLRALKLAESHVKKQKVDMSKHYLVEAKYTFIELEGRRVSCWRIRWQEEGSANLIGYDLESYVFMTGRVWLPPIM